MQKFARILAVLSVFAAGMLPLLASTALRVTTRGGVPGQVVQLPILFANDADQVALQFDVTFDNARLESAEPTAGEAVDDHLVVSKLMEPGRWRVLVYSQTNRKLGEGAVIFLPLTIRAGAPAGLTIVMTMPPIAQADLEATSSVPDLVQTGGVTIGDSDSDGITDAVEAGAPNAGDQNDDGTNDNIQSKVTSLPNSADGEFVLFQTNDSVALRGIDAADSPSPGDQPDEADFPLGFFSFGLDELPVGGSALITLDLPDGLIPNRFYHYGPTPENNTPHWYEFLYDGISGAEFDGGRVNIYLADGERGDHDLTINGQVTAFGGPAPEIPTSSGFPSGRARWGATRALQSATSRPAWQTFSTGPTIRTAPRLMLRTTPERFSWKEELSRQFSRLRCSACSPLKGHWAGWRSKPITMNLAASSSSAR